MIVTYGAAGFAFLFGGALVIVAVFKKGYSAAKDLFLAILPTATTIVTYWFSSRTAEKSHPSSALTIPPTSGQQVPPPPPPPPPPITPTAGTAPTSVAAGQTQAGEKPENQ